MSELLNGALDYARHDLPVLPLRRRGKEPCGRLVRHGLKNATTHEALIRGWWAAEPEANVGLRTGDGLAVLDVDPRSGGDVTLEALLAGSQLPRTPEVHTGGGGSHHYFQAPVGLRSCVLGPGLDLKAGGGYVVAPPSTHPSGRCYVWHPYGLGETPLASLPAWAMKRARLRAVTKPRRACRQDDDPLREIPAAEYVPALTGRDVDGRGFARCPFHKAGEERTPSLKVYAESWYCFACRIGGDIYALAGMVGGWGPTLRGPAFLTVQAGLLEHFGAVRAA